MFLSSKEIDYKEAIKRYIERTGNDLYKLVEKGEVIQLEDWHFITKENFESAKRKLAEYQKVIDNDILENSKINKFHIIQLCNHNIERIREQFKEYEKWLIDSDPDFIDCTFLFSFFKTIFEYPKIVIEAYGKYNGYEDTHQRIYYQYEIIFSFLAEKNQRIKLNEMDFQSFFNKRIFKKDEYLINVFMLIDTQLKFIVNIDYPFLHIAESEIFRTYFNFILEIRDYYISAFKDVKLRNIEHFENILKSTPEKKEHGTPPPTVEPQQKIKQAPKELKFVDFFDLNKIDETKVSEIKECFKNDEGKTLAALVELLIHDYKLIEIIPSSKTKSLKHFLKAIKDNDLKYNAVTKCFDEKNRYNYSKDDPILLSTNKKINEIIE